MSHNCTVAARRRLFAAAVLLIGLALFPSGVAVPEAHGASNSKAVVIVDTGDAVYIEVISFGSSAITGLEALQLAGASPETVGYSGQGIAVCKLYGVGHEPTRDTCLGTPSDPRYWAYYRAPPGATSFTYSQVGAGSTAVGDGYVEGWKFGTGSAPPFRSFCEIAGCPTGSGSTSGSNPPSSEPARGGGSPQGSGSGDAASVSANGNLQDAAATNYGSTPGSEGRPMDAEAAGDASLTPTMDPALTGAALPAAASMASGESGSEEKSGYREGLGAIGSAVALGIALAAIASAGIVARKRRLPPDRES